ncbi:hypothetical protein ACJ41O_000390 [Fusarium nematophilum]
MHFLKDRHEAPLDVDKISNDAIWLDAFPEEKKLKVVDWRLVPLITMLYLFSFMDRANIGNANIEGMSTSLSISGTEYNIALMIFFVPYVLSEVPSNYLLAMFQKPSRWLGTLVVGWGIMGLVMGLVKNFCGLVATRFMLGVFEAGFFPGAVFVVSKWYLRNETQTRLAIFYTASALAGAFSGLLAYVIAKMNGVGGLEGWRWIFLIEGIATVVAGILCLCFLIDSPASSTSWLDADEIRYLELRQIAQAGPQSKEPHRGSDWRTVRAALSDWQVYVLAVIMWSSTAPNNGLKFSMPQIVKNMGFESNAQLLTIPPYCAGGLSAWVSGLFADRVAWRMPFIVACQLIVIVGYSILFVKASDIEGNVALCYFAVILSCIGLYPIQPGTSAWTVNNVVGPKRALGVAYMICLGNLGGVIGSFMYKKSEQPGYPTGFGASLGFAALGVVLCFLLEMVYKSINRRRDGMTREEVSQRYTETELNDKGDRSPLFRYTL